ncbi:hypothetical protein ABPG72_008719 [Tetrahymena utriculariae]
MNKIIKDVIVVGAGISGLSAAHALVQRGFSVAILEAQSTFGGRISKNYQFADFPIEIGAEEIHLKESAYFQLAESVGAIIQSDDQVNHYIESPDEEILLERDFFFENSGREEFYQNVMKDCKQLSESMPVLEYLKQQKVEEKYFKFYENFWGAENGTSIKNISIKGLADYESGWKSDHDVNYLITNMSHFDVIEKAYSSVLNLINYNTPVQSIHYGADIQSLDTQNNEENYSVQITDKNGRLFYSKYALITVPVTQLKQGKIEFYPPLPEKKQQAIQSLQLGKGGKLHLSFKEKFWPNKFGSMILQSSIGMVWSCSDLRSEQSHVLCCLITEPVALDMNDPIKQKYLIAELLQKLSKIFKRDDIESLLNNTHWIEYSQIEYIEGNYTYPSLNMGNSKEILSQSIDNKLFFAGESTNPRYSSTIHGALETGLREAAKIIDIQEKQIKQLSIQN